MNNQPSLQGSKQEAIWLTGASSGIGYQIDKDLAALGHKVLVSARSESALLELARESKNIIALPFDVSDKSQIASTREVIKKECGTLDRIILNAGVCEYFDIDDPDWDMMRRVMEVNYFGVINSLDLALPLMEPGSHVVVVSSMASFAPFPRAQAYGASKSALSYFMSAMKVDLASRKIDVTIVNPGFVDTPLTQKNDFPMPFLVDMEQASKIIIDGLDTRPFTLNFPKKFSWLIKLFYLWPNIWFKFIAPRLSRTH